MTLFSFNKNENIDLNNIVKFIITISWLSVVTVPLKFWGNKIVNTPWNAYITHESDANSVKTWITYRKMTLGIATIHPQWNPWIISPLRNQINSKQNKTKIALSNFAAIMYQRDIFLEERKNQ